MKTTFRRSCDASVALPHAHQVFWRLVRVVVLMRANLDDKGKLTPPRNVERGLLRLKQLRYEIKRLGGEIDDAVDKHTATPGWLARAKKNKALLRDEAKQLIEWIGARAHEIPRCVACGLTAEGECRETDGAHVVPQAAP